MEKFLSFVVFASVLSCLGVFAHPADHREDTVLPFSLSPGNVNLETYYLDKYPKPSPGGQLKQKERPTPSTEGNGVQEEEQQQQPNAHGLFRSRRSANPVNDHGGSGLYQNQGHHPHFQVIPTYAHRYPHHHNELEKHNAHHGSQYSRYNRPQVNNIFADLM